jgi:hypothetical protein
VREEEGARGVVLAQVFAVQADRVEALAKAAEPTFARYRAAGVREAGVLVTLDVPNNFPRLPVRTDGPYLVWLGIVADDQALETGFGATGVPVAAVTDRHGPSPGNARAAGARSHQPIPSALASGVAP